MLYDMTIPQFIKILGNLSHFLDKAAQHADHKKFETSVYMNSRLAPNQFDFTKQVQIACDTAKLTASRLTGKEAPKNEDNEKTFAELKTRIESTTKFLKTITAKDFEGADVKRITTPRWEGKTLSGKDLVICHSIPNFYFHVTTAYAILRHNGVEVGKADYLGPLPF